MGEAASESLGVLGGEELAKFQVAQKIMRDYLTNPRAWQGRGDPADRTLATWDPLWTRVPLAPTIRDQLRAWGLPCERTDEEFRGVELPNEVAYLVCRPKMRSLIGDDHSETAHWPLTNRASRAIVERLRATYPSFRDATHGRQDPQALAFERRTAEILARLEDLPGDPLYLPMRLSCESDDYLFARMSRDEGEMIEIGADIFTVGAFLLGNFRRYDFRARTIRCLGTSIVDNDSVAAYTMHNGVLELRADQRRHEDGMPGGEILTATLLIPSDLLAE